MIVMLLGGLWHGAAWGYVLWGALHGGALVLHQSLMQFRNYLGRRTGTIASKPDWVVQLNNGFSILLTASFVLLAWVPFYTESISDALMLWSSAFSYSGEMIENANTLYERYGIEVGMLLVNITIGLALVFFPPTSHELVNFCVRRWQKLEGGTIHNVLAHPLMLFVYLSLIHI